VAEVGSVDAIGAQGHARVRKDAACYMMMRRYAYNQLHTCVPGAGVVISELSELGTGVSCSDGSDRLLYSATTSLNMFISIESPSTKVNAHS
jgi:hypothetical protein